MQPEKGEKRTFDVVYAFVRQMENLVRNSKTHVRVIGACNLLEEASDILTEQSIKEEIVYIIPYLTAIELYYMYQESPKDALETLRAIVVAEKKKYYNEYLKSLGINLNEHSEQYVKKLITPKQKA